MFCLFWNLNLKKVVVLHDSLFWKNSEDYSKIWRWYYLKCINYGINESTTIVTTSEYSKKSFKQGIKKKITLRSFIKVVMKLILKRKLKKIFSI